MADKATTKVLPCGCQSKQQDEIHGRYLRVHNYCQKKGNEGWRCTVCGIKRS